MVFFVIGALIIASTVIILFIETKLPLASKMFITIGEFFLLFLIFRPDSIRRKETDDYMNAMLKFNDEQKIVDKCIGCVHIREPYGKCSVYLFPWEAWSKGHNHICDDYKKSDKTQKAGEADG